METGKPSEDAKQIRRETRREDQRRRERQRRRRATAITIGIALATVAALGLGVWSKSRSRPGERVPGQGTTHIQMGQSHPAYNSNPPTSGWHLPQTVQWGLPRTEIPDEFAVHNLEHGGIWITYQDPRDGNLVKKLEALASRYPTKIIVSPRPTTDSAIAVVAWERLLKLHTYDETRIVEFIDAFRNRGPENVP